MKGLIIDYIITRDKDTIATSTATVSDLLPDHHLKFCDISPPKPEKACRTITYRNISTINTDSFKKDIERSSLVKDFQLYRSRLSS